MNERYPERAAAGIDAAEERKRNAEAFGVNATDQEIAQSGFLAIAILLTILAVVVAWAVRS